MVTVVVLYLVAGLLVMSAMQVCWPLIEYLFGVVLWPVVLGFFIREKRNERKSESLSYEAIVALVAMIRKQQEEQATKQDSWTPDRN